MMSSVQCYNVIRDIDAYDLKHLKQFTANSINKTNPFQQLNFIVRDKPMSTNGKNISPGGIKQTIADDIRTIYETFEIFPMHSPGDEVTQNFNFDGNIRTIDSAFKTDVKSLVNTLFDPEKMVLKKHDGKLVKVNQLVEIFELYVKFLEIHNV